MNLFVTGTPPIIVECVQLALSHNFSDGIEPCFIRTEEPEAAPDVVVVVALGTQLPAEFEHLRSRYPDAAFAWLAGEPSGAQVAKALRGGCSAVVSDKSEFTDLLTAIAGAAAGETWSTPDLLRSVIEHLRRPEADRGADLSPREREVIGLLAAGRSTEEIAGSLTISIHTARNHIRRILGKLDSHSRGEAIRMADARGLLGD